MDQNQFTLRLKEGLGLLEVELKAALPPFSDVFFEKCFLLMNELLSWNEKVNLTAITDPEEVIEKHFIDSLALLPFLNKGSLMDVGSGAGFPALPLAISESINNIFIIDSKRKKLDIINEFVKLLGIKNCKTEWVHLPEKKFLVKSDQIVSRGTFKANEFLNATLPCLKPHGVLILMKGKEPTDELGLVGAIESKNRLKRTLIQYHLPFSKADRSLVIWKAP